MSERGSHDPSQPQNSSTSRIDRVCDQFEKAWQAGAPPRIEDLLPEVLPPEQDRLLDELLEIEFDFRQRAGVFLQMEDYQCRFPENSLRVEAVFRRVVKQRKLGDYELLEELGHGGMGVVYKARQVYLNQTVAVKILPHRYLDDPQAVARFRREMQSIGSLDDPNIVRAYNAGETAGVHYLVMEYVDGVNLQEFVAADRPPCGPLDIGTACEVIRQAALGLQHAQDHGLVHRDVKPANLMLNRSGVVKLLDMGLAKFHAEWKSSDQPAGRLTQAGVAIGTIDFMAPEQWENSGVADIRSDIYSLGCTLFFLLTSRTPYGDAAYDTNRKKLMAHVVAPIPSLPDNCPDCPPELEDVFLRMMAKDPRDRFAKPADVANALSDLADPQAVAELVGAISASGSWNIPQGPATLNKHVSTSPRMSGGSTPRRRSSSRRKSLRKTTSPYMILGLLALFFGTMALTGFWMSRRPNLQPEPPPSDMMPVITTPAAAVSREALAADLALLPGLNGPPWFEEMPWLTPFARLAIAEKLQSASNVAAVLGDTPSAYFGPNSVEVEKWLWEVIGRCRSSMSPAQVRLLDQLKAFSESNREDAKHAAQALAEAEQQFADGHKDGIWSAVDRHTQAVVQHCMAQLQNDRTMAEKAKTNYDLALVGYASLSRSAAPTRLLCLVDSALLCAELIESPRQARRRFDEVLATDDLPVLFQVSTLVARGDFATTMATSPGEYEDHRYVLAKRLLSSSEAGKRSHGLAAYIAERYAWSLMDQWQVDDAYNQFKDAYHVRLTNKQEKNQFASIYVLHDQHGIAMTARYRGNLDGARRTYKSVVEDVKAALDEVEHQAVWAGQQSYRRALHERLANSLERWADCELYGGAASGASVNLTQAGDYYEKASKTTSDRGAAVTMTGKLAIVRALNGKRAAAQEAIALLDAQNAEVLGQEGERARLVRQVADAVLSLSGASPIEGRKALRTFLDQFKLNPSYRDSTRRETMELQLFADELLINSDLENDSKSAQRDLKYLDALLAAFKGRRNMRPYLRRYYDLAILACKRNDLIQLSHYQLEAGIGEQQVNLRNNDVALVLFHFTAKDNFAIFLPHEGSGKLFSLGITRQQIKEAASKGKALHLDDQLVQLVKDQQKAGRKVEIVWDDTTSWPSEDSEALSARDWPFGKQLDLAEFQLAPTPPEK